MSVCHPVVIIENEDCGHHAGSNHEHDGIEIRCFKENIQNQIYILHNLVDKFRDIYVHEDWVIRGKWRTYERAIWGDWYDGGDGVQKYGQR